MSLRRLAPVLLLCACATRQLALEPAFPSGEGWGAAWGFTLRDVQGAAVAALQLQGTQALWLAPGLAPGTRAAVRFAAAALLLKTTGSEGCPPRSR